MKKIILLITISLSLGNYSHGQVNNTTLLPTREVLPFAVYMWQVSFGLLTDKGIVDKNTRKFAKFSNDDLDTLYNCHRYGNANTRVITFRYYLENTNRVKVALTIPENPNQFLIYADSSNQFVDSSFFKGSVDGKSYDKFKAWENFVNASDVFVYIKEYRYNWYQIFEGLAIDDGKDCPRRNDTYSLLVEHVAHTVSPSDTLFEVRGHGINEGYIALDLLFTRMLTIEKKGVDTSLVLNFAMPCPRNCPK